MEHVRKHISDTQIRPAEKEEDEVNYQVELDTLSPLLHNTHNYISKLY